MLVMFQQLQRSVQQMMEMLSDQQREISQLRSEVSRQRAVAANVSQLSVQLDSLSSAVTDRVAEVLTEQQQVDCILHFCWGHLQFCLQYLCPSCRWAGGIVSSGCLSICAVHVHARVRGTLRPDCCWLLAMAIFRWAWSVLPPPRKKTENWLMFVVMLTMIRALLVWWQNFIWSGLSEHSFIAHMP